jgi:hypothetical protein
MRLAPDAALVRAQIHHGASCHWDENHPAARSVEVHHSARITYGSERHHTILTDPRAGAHGSTITVNEHE